LPNSPDDDWRMWSVVSSVSRNLCSRPSTSTRSEGVFVARLRTVQSQVDHLTVRSGKSVTACKIAGNIAVFIEDDLVRFIPVGETDRFDVSHRIPPTFPPHGPQGRCWGYFYALARLAKPTIYTTPG
jgi:hypothetical protein